MNERLDKEIVSEIKDKNGKLECKGFKTHDFIFHELLKKTYYISL